jgi:hypothetical protein
MMQSMAALAAAQDPRRLPEKQDADALPADTRAPEPARRRE